MESAARTAHSRMFKIIFLRQVYTFTVLLPAFNRLERMMPLFVYVLGGELFGDFDHITIVFFKLAIDSDSFVVFVVTYILRESLLRAHMPFMNIL